MKVEEIKAILPEADVYALNENVRYLVIARSGHIPHFAMDSLLRYLLKGSAVLLVNNPEESGIRMLEIKE